MYSRAFQEGGERLPPHYGGTALRQGQHREDEREEERRPPPECEAKCQRDTNREECCEPPRECSPGGEPPKGGLHFLLPYGIRFEDLMLLGLAVLLWLDGCEDEYLPLLLLFLLIVH